MLLTEYCSVMEFLPRWVIISKIFGQKSTSTKDLVFIQSQFSKSRIILIFSIFFFSIKNNSFEDHFQFKIHDVAFRAPILEAETVCAVNLST